MSFLPSDTVYGIKTPGELIKERRGQHGLSQRELAYRAGTSQSAIARIESGDEDITWKRLRSVLAAMGDEPVLEAKRLPQPIRAPRPRARARHVTGGPARQWHRVQPARFGALAKRGLEPVQRPKAADRPFQADEILRTLHEHRVDFVVIGGIAVQAHGYIRATQDLDIIVRPSTLNLTRLSEALADLRRRAPDAGDSRSSRTLTSFGGRR